MNRLTIALIIIVVTVSAVFWPEVATPQEQPKPAAIVGVDVSGALVIGHDIASGYKHPRLFAGMIVLGPHVGPMYIGGGGVLQGEGGQTATFVPIITYVGQGYIHGWFKKMTFSVGQTQERVLAGKPGWMFCVGIGR